MKRLSTIDFEESMNCFHADQIALFDSPRQRASFKAMMAADNDHVGSLRSVLAKSP